MQELDLHDTWFDCAKCRTARVAMDLLRGECGWSHGSGHLTPLVYFLWDYVKAYVYTVMPASIDALEDNIEEFIHEIKAVEQSRSTIG